MALNIKSEVADRLVEEVARLTGESKTQAVIESLRQRLEREQRRQDEKYLTRELLGIGEKCAAYGGDATPHGDLLYDDAGLPE